MSSVIGQHDDGALTALIAIENQTVRSARVSQHSFHLALEDCTLIVSAEANRLTVGSHSWIGNGSATG
jgi:anti-sigma factor ChrR (cupin superfamily)